MMKIIMAMVILLQLAVVLLSLLTEIESCSSGKFGGLPQTMHSAANRVLMNFVYDTKTVPNHIICGRECHMDEDCKSFNFYRCNKRCELSNNTRTEDPQDFKELQGGVYFDADPETHLFSITDNFHDYRNCSTLLKAGVNTSGVYTIHPGGNADECLDVYCDMADADRGWTVIQRRKDGSVDFYRKWEEYKAGFGELTGEFWLGNDNLVRLTSGKVELRIDITVSSGHTTWASYSGIIINPGQYELYYDSKIKSTAGVSLESGKSFTTKDRDNDLSDDQNCADKCAGAWWYSYCSYCGLNSEYSLLEERGLKECTMKITETPQGGP